MSMARRTDNTPMPDKIGHLLQESRWLGVGALMVFLVMALWGFQRSDPGWSNAVGAGALQNPAGRLGAWVADVLLYVFGLSAWWCRVAGDVGVVGISPPAFRPEKLAAVVCRCAGVSGSVAG